MSKFKRIISMVLGVVLCFTMAFSIVGCGNINSDDETVTVTDMLGEQVTVKKNPKKVILNITHNLSDLNNMDGEYYLFEDYDIKKYSVSDSKQGV